MKESEVSEISSVWSPGVPVGVVEDGVGVVSILAMVLNMGVEVTVNSVTLRLAVRSTATD